MYLVFSTFPTEEKATEISRQLVAERLIACASILPGVRSVYRWEGAVHNESEVLAILKCPSRGFPALQKRLRELHPYDLPEIVAVKPGAALPDYVAWVRESCPTKSSARGSRGATQA